ncbi:hypothetical protein [Williamwhitmania taraxaci]|uniref:Uncharacterized protein n=1 Tax=Williamwhitmania taraxaci TaxID=1640674 RepID=A0A1G6KZ74_9BACT|nr:hypothetical protein [Williamwhitmania taraxaci]SDC35666.1 hypothetical protein SAMN05216323_102737 [Williamwhitmania taraxaci]
MKSEYVPKTSAVILAAFALLTLFLTTSIFFDLFGIREREGRYVLFVVIANFICSLLYFPSIYGFWSGKRWTTYLLFISSTVLITTLIAFLLYISNGGLHETKTTGALIFRIALTTFFWVVSYKCLSVTKK